MLENVYALYVHGIYMYAHGVRGEYLYVHGIASYMQRTYKTVNVNVYALYPKPQNRLPVLLMISIN